MTPKSYPHTDYKGASVAPVRPAFTIDLHSGTIQVILERDRVGVLMAAKDTDGISYVEAQLSFAATRALAAALSHLAEFEPEPEPEPEPTFDPPTKDFFTCPYCGADFLWLEGGPSACPHCKSECSRPEEVTT